MFTRIDHIGIAVDDLERGIALYREGLGLSLHSRERLEASGLEVAVFEVGNSHLELLASRRPGTPIEKFVERRGSGIHHVALEVDDIEAALAACRARGLQPVDDVPRPGAGGTRTAFLHPKSVLGVLIELVELPRGGATRPGP